MTVSVRGSSKDKKAKPLAAKKGKATVTADNRKTKAHLSKEEVLEEQEKDDYLNEEDEDLEYESDEE